MSLRRSFFAAKGASKAIGGVLNDERRRLAITSDNGTIFASYKVSIYIPGADRVANLMWVRKR